MLCVKVPVKEAEKVKKELVKEDLFDKKHYIKKDKGFVYFPVKKRFSSKHKLVHKILRRKKVKTDVKTALTKKLNKKDLEVLRTSMDIIGNIAILEIPKELDKKKKKIAQEFLKNNKNIKTVLKKGKHQGMFRIQKLELLAGEKNKEAVYIENNVTLKVDVEKVYFSPRLSNDRKEISQLVKKGEDILVMFSGCAPYVCVIAKNSKAKQVYGVEINPTAHNYALENILLNKLNNTAVFLGDVKSIVSKLNKNFDRILMPHPTGADKYLDVALKVAKKGAVIHFYEFQKESETDKSVGKIKKACEHAKRKCTILRIVKCGQHAPREFRIRIDFKV